MTTYWCEPIARTEEKSTVSSEEADCGNTITI
jgi:hypothetical protein